MEWKEIESAGLEGTVQIKTPRARSESGLLPAPGAGWESGDGLAWQHGMVTPCLQQERACLTHAAVSGADVASNGAPASRKPQTMASVVFMFSPYILSGDSAAPLLAFACQFLAFAFASAALMIFMYLSGSPRNVGLHIGQQNLISWLMLLV